MWSERGRAGVRAAVRAGGVALPLFIMLHVYFMCVCVCYERCKFIFGFTNVTKISCPNIIKC